MAKKSQAQLLKEHTAKLKKLVNAPPKTKGKGKVTLAKNGIKRVKY